MATVATLVAKLEADVRDFDRGIGKAERELDRLEDSTKKADKRTRSLTGSMTGLATKAAIGAAAVGAVSAVAFDAVKSFSDLEESINAVNVQFGDGAGTILAFGETAAESVGLANSAFNQLSVVTGATLSAFIDDEREVADETVRLTQRASDMASVFNTDVDQALGAVQAALRGETEPIRRFGVLLDDASVRARAVELGLAATTSEVDKQAKGLAALDLIYEQTDKTAGDFANTSDSVANRMRVLGARFEDAKATVGGALVPAFEALLDLLESSIPLIEGFAKGLKVVVDLAIGSSEFRNLHDNFDLLNQLVADGATEAEAWAEVYGGKVLPSLFDTASNAIPEAVQQWRNLQTVTEEAQAAMPPYIDAAKRMEASIRGIGVSADVAAERIINLAREQAAAADPVLNLIRRNAAYEDAIAKVAEVEGDAEASAEDLLAAQLGQVEAWGDLIAASGVFEAGAITNIEAFKNMALEAGLAEDVIAELIAILGSIPTDVTTHITVTRDAMTTFREHERGSGGPAPPTLPPFIGGMAMGGIVPGPIGAPVAAIVHGGEEVIPADQRGGGGVTIGTAEFNIRGMLDQSDPAAARRLAVEIREEMDRLNAEVP